MSERETVLAHIAAIVDRGGEADDVLRSALAALVDAGIGHAAIRFVERGTLLEGPGAGAPTGGGSPTG